MSKAAHGHRGQPKREETAPCSCAPVPLWPPPQASLLVFPSPGLQAATRVKGSPFIPSLLPSSGNTPMDLGNPRRPDTQERPRNPDKSPTWAPFLRTELDHPSQTRRPSSLSQSHL